jgi:pilus assembly protein CpaB
MRRGRIFIYLALIVIVAVAAVAGYLWTRQKNKTPAATQTQATPQLRYIEIVTAGQNIYPGTPITESMLASIQIREDQLVVGEITDKALVINMYAKYPITQGVVITESMFSATPGNVNLPGSTWAPFIPQGLTAVAIPASRLSVAAYGIRDGDYVNVIVTMLLVDVDPASQSILPNDTAGVLAPGMTDKGQLLTAQVSPADKSVMAGRTEYDETLQQPLYIVPSEGQRPRLVTQMIMQNVQVLHVGTFPLPGEVVSDQQIGSSASSATPTPVAGNQAATSAATMIHPDIITLMVTPQDAVTLTYLVYSGAGVTLTLRNPNDQQESNRPDAATLEYLLTQYDIPIPAKLPYALQPRLDAIKEPKLPNDATPVP